jgi:hypothetical protein
MSAAIFATLRDEFSDGWLGSRGQQFTVEILSPGSFCRVGNPNVDTVNYEKQLVVGSVCLPFSTDADGSTPAVVVMAKRDRESHNWLPSRESIDEFVRLCAKAGTALPLKFRNRLARYHNWETERDPANWWLSVLVALHEFTVYNADGVYQKQQFITNPWQMSIDAIEYLRLNTDSPLWPEDTKNESSSEATTNLVDFDDVRTLVGVGRERLKNVVSEWRGAGKTVAWPMQYTAVRPLIVAQWPKLAMLFPESFEEFQRILATRNVSGP